MKQGVFCQEIPVTPLTPVRVRERVFTEDGKIIFRMEEDVFDEEAGLIADIWRCITDNDWMKEKLREGAQNFPDYIRIVNDEDTLVAECNKLVAIHTGGYLYYEIVVYPLLGHIDNLPERLRHITAWK